LFPRDRDERITTSPPPGSVLAIAEAESRRMRAAVPRDEWPDEGTPVGASDYETLAFRASKAAKNSAQAIEGIAAVRVELQRTSERMDAFDGRLDDLHGAVKTQGGQLEILVGFAQRAHEAALHAQTVTVTSRVRVEEHQQLAQIDESREVGKFKRDISGRLVGVLVAIGMAAAAGVTALISKC
jgi:hypothetical protein